MTTATTTRTDRHGISWQTYQCTGCGRTEVQRADVLAVTCHRIADHRPRKGRTMQPVKEARR